MQFTKSPGQASRTLIILIFVILCAGLLVYVGLKLAGGKPAIPVNDTASGAADAVPQVVVPPKVYDFQLEDIKVTMQSAVNLGNILYTNPNGDNAVKTTEKFILVSVIAENIGKTDTGQSMWDLGNMVDSDGRVFGPADYRAQDYMRRFNSACGAPMKPGFTPTPCVRLYEVAKISHGLKLEVRISDRTGKQTVEQLDLNSGD